MVSGSGNVAIYAIEKVHALGGHKQLAFQILLAIFMILRIDLALLKEIKEVKRRLTEYVKARPESEYIADQSAWTPNRRRHCATMC